MRRRNRYLLHIWGYIVPTLPFSLESVVSLLIAYCFHLFRPHSHYYALILTIITLLPCYLLTLFPVTLLPCYPVILLPHYPDTLPAQCYPVTLFFILCYPVTQLTCYPLTSLPCIFVTLLPCYLVTVFPYNPVTLSH